MELPFSTAEIERILVSKGWEKPIADRERGLYVSRQCWEKGPVRRPTMIDAWMFEEEQEQRKEN